MRNVIKATSRFCDDETSLSVQNIGGMSRGNSVLPEYLKTGEAANYLRKSTSWLVKRNDIPYLKGVPNVYRKCDLDEWFDRNKFDPSIN